MAGPERRHREAVTRGDVAGLRVRRRLDQIADRLNELHTRSHEVSEPSYAPELDRARLLRAASNASQARAHAAEAAQLALAAYVRSAEVHDRVADLYDQLAAAGSGDIARYRQQAERHRMLAAKDRNAAVSYRGGTGHTDAFGPDQSGADDRTSDNG
jgi:hypothetical protein